MTPRRPSRPALSPLHGDTARVPLLRCLACRGHERLAAWSFGIPVLLPGFGCGDGGASQVPVGPQFSVCLVPATPASRAFPRPLKERPYCPCAVQYKGTGDWFFRGSIARLPDSLSTPRRKGCPYTTQDSLPAAGQAFPRGILPTRSLRKVSYVDFTYFLLSRAS